MSKGNCCQHLCGESRPLRRLVAISCTVWPVLGLYLVIDHFQSAPPSEVMMPYWVPFWPAFTLPYLAMLPVTWLLPVAIRDAAQFRACLWALVCAYILVMPWWILTPTTLTRPPLPEGWWMAPYRWLTTVDPPHNVMPCAHGIGPMIGAWFVSRDRPTWRWPLAGMLVLGLSSIPLVWQHRPFDIVLGTVAAVIGIAFAETWNSRRQTRLQES